MNSGRIEFVKYFRVQIYSNQNKRMKLVGIYFSETDAIFTLKQKCKVRSRATNALNVLNFVGNIANAAERTFTAKFTAADTNSPSEAGCTSVRK